MTIQVLLARVKAFLISLKIGDLYKSSTDSKEIATNHMDPENMNQYNLN